MELFVCVTVTQIKASRIDLMGFLLITPVHLQVLLGIPVRSEKYTQRRLANSAILEGHVNGLPNNLAADTIRS